MKRHPGRRQDPFSGCQRQLRHSDHASVALVGVENLVVVSMGDAVLVASKEAAEAIKSVVERLKASGEDIAVHHKRVYRPWGWYEDKPRRALPSEMHHGEARRHALTSEPQSPIRALGGGQRHPRGNQGGRNELPHREPIDLHRNRRET